MSYNLLSNFVSYSYTRIVKLLFMNNVGGWPSRCAWSSPRKYSGSATRRDTSKSLPLILDRVHPVMCWPSGFHPIQFESNFLATSTSEFLIDNLRTNALFLELNLKVSSLIVVSIDSVYKFPNQWVADNG